MSRLQYRLPDGQTVVVTIPARVTFSKPATDAQAIAAFSYAVAKEVLPHVRRLPARTELIRGASGQVTGSTQHQAASREVVANAIGLAVARDVLGLDE